MPPPEESPVRPDDDAVVGLASSLAWQRDHVASRGAAVAAESLQAVLDDVEGPAGRLAGLLPARVRFGDLAGLRVMAAVHRLALARLAPAVAVHLPTLGGTPPADEDARAAFRFAVVDALAAHRDVLARSLAQTPQTNETGRAPMLRCALSRLPSALPVRLFEIGTSAGLNLRADHLAGVPWLEAGPLPPIVERIGCDLHPIDAATAEGRLALSSYIWVDDVDRFARLGRALDVARRVPVTLVAEDAADFVEGMRLVDGTTTVLWHSAFWLYLTPVSRKRVQGAIDTLGRSARAHRRFTVVSWEWDGSQAYPTPSFALTMREWGQPGQDGSERVIARGDSHGGSEVLLDA